MVQAQPANLCGSVISGRYQIVESLGQGDMAHVYLANDQKTGENVAILVMHDDLSNDPVFLERFEIEARATSSLNHPNIVRVIGFGQDHERRYIVQEYVEGCSLKELINTNGAIPWQTAVPMAIQIGLALEHLHENDLVHRDIKPHNILITREQIAMVTYFGITQAMTSNMIPLTSKISFDSVHYSSPENARGSIMGEKSDIYSLGILIYEMVTGRVPFDGDTPVVIAIEHLQEIPPSPSLINRTVPQGLDQIIMKCIQKSPDKRYKNVHELVNELEALSIDPKGIYGIVAGLPDRYFQTTALQALNHGPKFSKLREIEQTIIERRHSRHRDTAIVIAIILAAIVFVTSIGAWGWSKLSDSIQPKYSQSYKLANYVGRELSEVLRILEKDNILIDVVYSENPTVIVGLITAQTPSSGVMIKKTNTKMILTVSSGPDLQVIPDLSGQLSAKAQTELTQTLGYKITIMAENARIDQGKVTRTIPAAGQKAPRGGRIILVISNGMPLVAMPNFVGKSLTDARSQIVTLRLILGPISSISGFVPEANRIVIRQSVPAGSQIMEESIISLTYGTAQDYANFRNPTPALQPPTLAPTTEPLPTPTTAPLPTPTPTLTTTPSPTPTTAPLPTPTPTLTTTPSPTPTTTPLPTPTPTTEPTATAIPSPTTT